MAVVKNKAGEGQKFWSHVELVAEEVSKWPAWMQGRERAFGDRSDENGAEYGPASDLAKAS